MFWLFLFFWQSFAQHIVIPLNSWQIQSSSNLSSPWYNVQGTPTVVAGLIQNGMFPNIYYGENLQSLNAALFATSWHYRTNFTIDSSNQGKTILLIFKGINYRANINLNSKQIGSSTDVVGTFRYFEFDISSQVSFASPNELELEIFKPNNSWTDSTTTDLALTFVDWAPVTPDANIGLWREVELHIIDGAVSVNYPLVTTLLNTDLTQAKLSVMAELHNYQTTTVSGTLTAAIAGLGSINKTFSLTGGQVMQATFDSADFPLLTLNNPQLWWPWQMGTPYLYNLTLTFTVNGVVSDVYQTRFGIRTMEDAIDSKGHRIYKVNGKNILIRGAGYCPDLFLTSETNHTWQDQVMRLTKHMHLNAIRFEGKFPSDHIFDVADEMGILMIPGWCCCDSWQHWSYWKAEQNTVAQESTRSQVKRLRIHASVLSFWYSSDELPPSTVETNYLNVFKAEQWPNTLLASASELTSSVTGPTGVKMSGPYSWVSPNYWLLDTSDVGGAFGFLTEGGPGEAPLPLEQLEVTIPSNSLWPINDQWNYHCGAQQGMFGNLNRFTPPLNSRYGNAVSAADYLRKAQADNYDGLRAMFEGYSRNKYTSSGVIQWMLNNAWPGNIWHLFDGYLAPNPGGYFGTRKACEPVHIQYSYDDDSIWVINSLYTPTPTLYASADVYNLSGAAVYHHEVNVASVGADAGVSLFKLPSFSNVTTTYFLRLQLVNNTNGVVSKNDYWLSTVPDVPEFKKSTWYNTPYKSYADLSGLQTLPSVTLASSASTIVNGTQMRTTVTISNPSTNVAFLVHARLLRHGAIQAPLSPVDISPIFWTDNYITLLPDETATLEAVYDSAQAGYQNPDLVVEVFNNIK